jgi:aminoglycoside phosphotransferase (APT) family kinase protein
VTTGPGADPVPTGPVPKPAAEVDIDEALVRALLRHQVPPLAEEPLVHLGAGWDNALYRLGDGLVVRLPRRELSAHLVEGEARWLRVLAPALPLAVPVPVHVGEPGDGYPWSWTIVPWLEGRSALEEPPALPIDAADSLGLFVRELHRPARPGAPENPYRGIPLADRTTRLAEGLDALGPDPGGPGGPTRAAIEEAWAHGLAAAPHAGPPVWAHGDLHPGNVLVHDGRVHAVIDFGDLTAGDPAVDLAVAWMLFEGRSRERFRAAAGRPDDDTWARSRAWAVALSVAYLASSADDPGLAGLGRRTLAAAVADVPA